jgi:hypothetical protein
MRGKGLRHLLPVVATVLYATLVIAGLPKQREIRKFEESNVLIEGHPRPPQSLAWAIGISFPAALASLPIVWLASQYSPAASDFVGLSLIGLLTPWLWFAVGRWVDLRLGILNTPQTKALSDAKRFLFGLCLVVLLALDGLFLYALLFEHIYQGLALAYSMVFWSSLGGWYCFSHFRARPARAVGSHHT